MNESEFRDKFAAFCADRFGDGVLSALRRLSGGANMESWAFDHGGRGMVLRRLPGTMADRGGETGALAEIPLKAQADLIALARRHGVTAPEVLARLEPDDGLGIGFVMAKVDGETLPQKVLGNPEFAAAELQLAQQCATELAAIHAIPPDAAPAEVRLVNAATLLATQEAVYRTVDATIPAYDFAFRWLEDTMPPPAEPRLLHGDFRMGNLMIDKEGISAVLDWELAHIGDPLEDLAYLCTPSWRFGHYEKQAGGFASADALIVAYEEASGETVDRKRFDWWLVYNTLWWGAACLRMGNSYRDGTVRTLERTIIGRRVSEVEIDLLLLFADKRGGDGDRLDWAEPPLAPDAGEIRYSEVLDAVRAWNKEAVMPDREGHGLFESRVANNALGIAQRAAAWGENFAAASMTRLDALGTNCDTLCADLRNGKRDLSDDALWTHLRLSALERLSIDQPKYAGLRVARERWVK